MRGQARALRGLSGASTVDPNPALPCCVMETGLDHILFAVDWPSVADNKPAVEWKKDISLCGEDKVKISSGNAQRLLRM